MENNKALQKHIPPNLLVLHNFDQLIQLSNEFSFHRPSPHQNLLIIELSSTHLHSLKWSMKSHWKNFIEMLCHEEICIPVSSQPATLEYLC